MSYDRYNRFRFDGDVVIPPLVEIPKKSTDFYETYRRGYTRLDILSANYYGDPGYDWLILMANPSLGALEFEIPDGAEVRIPYPLSTTIENYNTQIERHMSLYGVNEKTK